MRFVFWACAIVGWVGCSGKSTDEDSSAAGAGDGTTDGGPGAGPDSGDGGGTGTTDPTVFPDPPTPFSLEVSGAYTGTLRFDTPSCSHRTGSTTFRQFWRGSDHVFVLLIEMFDTFPGEAGAYVAADGVRARLQEEAGGSLYYFDSLSGDNSATLELVGFDTDANQVWGSGTVGVLGDSSGGTVTLSPDAVPVWCDSME